MPEEIGTRQMITTPNTGGRLNNNVLPDARKRKASGRADMNRINNIIMKKIFYLPAAVLAIASCGNNSELKINGTTDTDAQNVYIVAGSDTLATVPVVDGKFSAVVPVDEPLFLHLREDTGAVGAVISEGGKVTYTMADKQFKAVGTKLNDIYDQYREASRKVYDEYRNAETDEEKEAASAKADALDMDFLDSNLDNWLGVYALTQSQYSMTGEEILDVIENLAPEFAENKDVIKVKGRALTMMKTAVGNPYIEIKLPSPKGNEISLSDVVAANKYVLVDFWASWCGPCMGEVPYLVKDYAEYKSKGFEIYGVSLDRTAEPWVKAIEDNKMDWIHVSDLKYWDCAPAGEYGVYSIPSNYLIDNAGTIIARNLRGENLGKKLAELLGE